MYFITGDTHRDFSNIEYFCTKFNTTKEDTMIVLGDAGLNYFLNNSDLNVKQKVSNLPIKFFFIRGNHESRPQNISTYKEKEYCGSYAYFEDRFPDLAFAKDGEIYTIEDKSILTIGGAYSIDKEYRIVNRFQWFEDEMLSSDEMSDILNKYKGVKVDCILSHTAPNSEIPYYMLPSSLAAIPNIDKTMEDWLDKIKENIEHQKWFCGHFHIEYMSKGNCRFMYKDIVEFI